MKPALGSHVNIQFDRTRKLVDPLEREWQLTVTMRDTELRQHTYTVFGNDMIVLPSVEVLTAALLKLLMEGVKE